MHIFGLKGHQTANGKRLRACLMLASFLVGVGVTGTVLATTSSDSSGKSTFTNWLDEDMLRSDVASLANPRFGMDTGDIPSAMGGKDALLANKGISSDEEKVLYAPTTAVAVTDIGELPVVSDAQKEWHAKPVPKRKYGSMKSPWIADGEVLSEAEKAVVNGDINAYLDFDDEEQVIVKSPSYGRVLGNEQDVDIYPVTVGVHTAFDDLWNEREEAADWSASKNSAIGTSEVGVKTDVVSIKKAEPAVVDKGIDFDFSSGVGKDDLSVDWIADIDDVPVPVVDAPARNPDVAGMKNPKVATAVGDTVSAKDDKDVIATDKTRTATDRQLGLPVAPGQFGEDVGFGDLVPATSVDDAVVAKKVEPMPLKVEDKISLPVVPQVTNRASSVLEIEPVVSDVEVNTDSPVPVLVPQPVVASQPLLLPVTPVVQAEVQNATKAEEYLPFGAVENAFATDKTGASGDDNSKTNVERAGYSSIVARSERPRVERVTLQTVVDNSSVAVEKIGAQAVLIPHERISFIFAPGSANFSLDNVKSLKIFTKQALAEGRTKADVILADNALKLQSLRFAVLRAVMESNGFDGVGIRSLLTGSNTDEVIIRTYGPRSHLNTGN